jgi:hypothetical protein
MNDVWIELAYYAGLILIPMIPALVLMLVLPGEAFLAGPLRGLKFNVAGGLAGYLIILLILSLITPYFGLKENQEVWRVKGKVQFESTEESEPLLENVKIAVNPPIWVVTTGGDFDLLIPVDRRGIQREFPNFTLEYPGYQTESLILDKDQRKGISDDNIDYITSKQKIVVKATIPLKEK